MNNDVSRVLKRWQKRIYGKEETGLFINGRWVASIEDINFLGVIQPASPSEVKEASEGGIISAGIKIHTKTKLEPYKTSIKYDGYDWRVIQVYDPKLGSYYKGIAVKHSETTQTGEIGWDTPLAEAWDTPLEDAWNNPLGTGPGQETTIWNTPLPEIWDDSLEDQWSGD